MVESYHWHLDVTFREDGNHTLEKPEAYNPEYHKKTGPKYIKTDRSGKQNIKFEKEAVCNRNKSGKTFKTNYELVIF